MASVYWVVVGVGIALAAVAAVLFALVLRRGRARGTRGFGQRSHLRCPKCGHEFDYDWVPGASLTAVRLGTARYLACPQCRRWSVFDVYGTLVARPDPSGPRPGGGPSPPPG